MRKLKLIIMLLISLLLSGCYGKVELDDLAYAIAIGADLSESGDESEVDITYQIAIPVKIAGTETNTGKDTFTTYTVTAPSLAKANSLVNTITSKQIDLSHVELILYSEELAQKSLTGHINSLISNVDIRPRSTVAICKGKAKDFLEKVSPVSETSPARYYELILSSYNYTSQSAGSEILNFYTATQSPYECPLAVIANLKEESEEDENKEATFSGLSVFKGTKLVGELQGDEVLAHLILSNNLNEAVLVVSDSENQNKVVTLIAKQSNSPDIKVSINNNIPHIEVTAYIEARLESDGGNTDYLKEENKNRLHDKIKEHVKNILENYLEKTTKNLKADAAGFGRYAKSNYLTWPEFEEINWHDIYEKSTYNIEVNVNLNVSQIVSHSLPTQE